ncbi:VPA1269 family protein [Paraburkholderia sp. BR13444]|uniref:gamma-mobile-trio integrase GmtZ n=1 Tax=Paraburkholderia sp. BR13444 TaxID=3236997 RepID=UPI0034CD4FA0
MSEELKREAIARVEAGERARDVAADLGISESSLRSALTVFRRRDGYTSTRKVHGNQRTQTEREELKRKFDDAVDRFRAGERIVDIAKSVNLSRTSIENLLGRLRKTGKFPPGDPIFVNVLSAEEKESRRAKLQLALRRIEHGEPPVAVAHELGIAYETVMYHMRKTNATRAEEDVTATASKSDREGKSRRTYPEALRAQAVALAKEVGVAEAAARLEVTTDFVRHWVKKAGVSLRRQPTGRAKSWDQQLRWVSATLPQLEQWRAWAERWIAEVSDNINGRLKSLKIFFQDYLSGVVEKRGLSISPDSLLLRTTALPPLDSAFGREVGAKYKSVVNNHIVGFVQWIVDVEYSIPDDYDRPVPNPMFHNPFKLKHARSATPLNSVRAPLPYGYIDELRKMIAEGANFRDWKFATTALGSDVGMPGRPGPEWFEVTESDIDLDDPDCVWRKRVTARGQVIEMWSPVRWVALLIKLQLPLRTTQVRLLDSGEADTWRFELSEDGVAFTLNRGALAQGTPRKPRRQAVVRRSTAVDGPNLKEACVVYITTNKTADEEKSKEEKGYDFPWPLNAPLHSNPIYWLTKLRDWQEKYNSISRLTPWTELDSTHINAKSAEQLAGYLDASFLFRCPENGEEFSHLPLARATLEVPWYQLLSVFEKRLVDRGERLADGSPIILVDPDSITTTAFPLHSLRVSLITALAIDGKVPFPILQKASGHSRLPMLLYYVNPDITRTVGEIKEAVTRLDATKAASIVEFLKTTDFRIIEREAIFRSPDSIGLALAEHPSARNAAGWMPMHHGLCLVGGNTTPLVGNKNIGGCYNGGRNLGSEQNPKFGPVPGGARNCIRCRWFVSKAHYLPALVAHMNVILYNFNESQNECIKEDRLVGLLRGERADAELSGREFARWTELKDAERRFESAMQRFSDLAEDAESCNWFIQRCFELATEKDSAGALIARGSPSDFKVVFEECEAELMQLSVVCESVAHFPDLQPGKAVLRRSQLLDLALAREGHAPMFLRLNEEEQLLAGNAFMAELSAQFNPANPALGARQVISLIDMGESISNASGLDVKRIAGHSVRKGLLSPKLQVTKGD